jgi:hypothetical protein
MPWHFYYPEKRVLRATKKVFDFLKILPDTAPFPNGEKIFNTEAYIKKIKLIEGGQQGHFRVLRTQF